MAFDLTQVEDVGAFTAEPVTAHVGEMVLLARVGEWTRVAASYEGSSGDSPAIKVEFATLTDSGEQVEHGQTYVFGRLAQETAGRKLNVPFGGRLLEVEFKTTTGEQRRTYAIDSQDAVYLKLKAAATS